MFYEVAERWEDPIKASFFLNYKLRIYRLKVQFMYIRQECTTLQLLSRATFFFSTAASEFYFLFISLRWIGDGFV